MSKKRLDNRLENLFDVWSGNEDLPAASRFDAPGGCTWSCDALGAVLTAGEEIRDVLGYEPRELAGKHLWTLAPDEIHGQNIRAFLFESSPPAEHTTALRRKDGQTIPARLSILSNHNGSGWSGLLEILGGTLPISPESAATIRASSRPEAEVKLSEAAKPRLAKNGARAGKDSKQIAQTTPLPASSPTRLDVHQGNGAPAALSATLTVQNQPLGQIELIDENPERVWSEEEQRLVAEVLDQLSLALENADLFQQTQTALSETERLYKVSADFNAAATLEEILRSLALSGESGEKPFAALLWQFQGIDPGQPQEMWLSSQWVEDGFTYRLETGTRLSLDDRQAVSGILSQPYEPRLYSSPQAPGIDTAARQIMEQSRARSAAFLPLSISGRWIGQVALLWHKPLLYQDRDLQRYRSLAAQAAVAVNNRLLFDQTENRARQLEWLSLVKDSLSQAADEGAILSAVSMALDLEAPPKWIAMDYFDTDEAGSVKGIHGAAFWRDGMLGVLPAARDLNLALQVYASLFSFSHLPDRAFFSGNVREDERTTAALAALAKAEEISAACILPLYSAGRWLGAITFAWKTPYQLSADEGYYLREMLEPVSALVASRRAYNAEQTARRAMERRNLQLQTAAQVSRAASSILEPSELVRDVVNLVQQRFELYYVGLFLVDESGEWSGESGKWAVLRAGSGNAGKAMLESGHKLALNDESMIGRCIGKRQAQIWRDDEDHQPRFRNPHLPETRSEMALPLVSRGGVIGAMTFQSALSGDFSPADISVLQTMADQVANAIQNARLFGSTQIALAETEKLYNASAELNTAQSYPDILRTLAAHSPILSGYQTLRLYFYDRPWSETEKPDEIFMLARLSGSSHTHTLANLQLADFPHAEEFLRRAIPTALEDLHQAEKDNHPLAIYYRTRFGGGSLLLIPLVVAGRWIGFIEASFVEPCIFPEVELRRLMALVAQAAVAFQNLHSIDLAEQRAREAQKRSDELGLINRVVSNINALLDLKSALGMVAHELGSQLSVQVGIALMNAQRDGLVLLAEHHLSPGQGSAIGFTIPVANNPSTQKVLETRRPLVIEDAQHNPLTAQIHTALTERGVENLYLFPILSGTDVIGTIGLDILEKGRLLSHNEIQLAETVIIQAATAIQNVRLFEQTQEALAETEALYQANAELSAAQSYAQVLNILRRYTILGEAASHAALALFERPWTAKDRPQRYTPLTCVPQGWLPEEPRLLAEWGTVEHLLQQNIPTFVADLLADPRLDAAVRQMYAQQQVHGMVFAPLNAGGRWIGFAQAAFQQVMNFNETELRRLTTLVGQAAVVIQNIRSAEQTRQRAAQLEKLATLQAALSQAGNEKEILSALVLPTDPQYPPDRISLEYIHTSAADKPESAELVAMWENGELLQLSHISRSHVAADPLAALWISGPDETIFINILAAEALLSAEVREALEQSGIHSLAIIPLRSGGIWQGVVTYAWKQPYEFQSDDFFLLRRILEPAAEVVARRRAFIAQRHARQESERRAVQLQTAAEIARDTTGTLALNELLSRAIKLVSERYGFYHAAIYLLDEEGGQARLRAAAGAAAKEMLAENYAVAAGPQTVIGYVLSTGEMLAANNLRQDGRRQPHSLLAGTASELTIPLKIGDKVTGALDVQSEQAEAFTHEDAAVLQVLADQLAVAVDNARSYEVANQAFQQARQRAQEMTLLFSVSQALASAPLASDEIAAIVTEQFARVLEVPECSLLLLNSFEDGSTSVSLLGAFGEGDQNRARYQAGVALNEHPTLLKAVQTLQPVMTQSGDENVGKHVQQYLRRRNIQTLLTVPLAVKGEAIGAIELVSHQWARYFSPDQLNLAMTLANSAAVALENARLYEEQRQTTERLQEVDTLKTQFLANMSHELRTPLNSIIGFSRVILKGIDGPITDLQSQDLGAIYNSGQHLLSLINDILDLSKIEAGKMELALEDVDLNDMINSVMSTAVGLTKEKTVELQREIDPDLPIVHVDRTRIRQVLINLLSNAAKFTEEGYIRIIARRQLRADDQPEIYLAVTDTGPGIAAEDQDKLFKAFSQVDASPTRKSGGTGLGLSISRHLVEMHGGLIGVDSEVGMGSTFHFTIPLTEIVEEVIPEPAAGELVILSVDDNRQVISLYERYLSGYPYRVIPVTNPENALEMARRLKPFAITLDIMMPGRDGWSVLQQLKYDPETRSIPVIICSILEDQERGFSLGASDYLIKPILEEDLVPAVRKLDPGDTVQRVLVVDDNPADLRLVQKILEGEGRYRVELAQSGHEALVALRENPPHTLILDLYMPDLDGFTLLETIKADRKLRDIPVIILSGGDLDAEQRNWLADLGENILPKGLLSEGELLRTLERSLNRFVPPGNSELG